jgi:hypothetical protein
VINVSRSPHDEVFHLWVIMREGALGGNREARSATEP